MKKLLPLLLALASSLGAAEFKAGVARTIITPPLPFWQTGYASRTNPAASVKSDLWAKALALEDEQGGRAVIVTTDLIGLPREISEAVADRVQQRHGLQRSQLLFNSSHTHAGPVVLPTLSIMFNGGPKEREQAVQYGRKLTDDLAAVVQAALSNLAPARLSFARGYADFATNRREPTTNGTRLGVNPSGPVAHEVPVLRVLAPDGALRAVLFAYACHNTTLGGDFYQVDGDYAGYAQREVEKAHPGATALFMQLCGGDQNPRPRGTYAHVEQHGKALAEAVNLVLAGTFKELRPPIRTAWQRAELEFAPHTRRAKLMLATYAQDKPIRRLSYPVQALRFNTDLTLVAMGGEVVVDYLHRARREFSRENLVVAGYCNEVDCYIPSRRVLREGGYEPVDSMIYYGQPGPFADNVEETVFAALREVLAGAGANLSAP
ncbi:MAG: neutral/alkaline non-lysosomal ceramidase N-terminal domain-containing protein [Verrucomicrobia bacterium]|nr:neutral/alkaline non-lysosomal ceramidase N-terminal domain-containing protein [Verrucomicrobiota bacterium]